MPNEEGYVNEQEYISLQEKYYDLDYKYSSALKRIKQLEQIIINNEIKKLHTDLE